MENFSAGLIGLYTKAKYIDAAAQSILDAELYKHGMTIDQLENVINSGKKVRASFPYSSDFEASLIVQLLSVVLGCKDATKHYTLNSQSIVSSLTEGQRMQIQKLLEHHRPLFVQTLTKAMTDYVVANKLLIRETK